MDITNEEDLEALRTEAKRTNFSDQELKEIHKNVKKIILEQEKKQRKLRRAEMESFYEARMYA